jgi:hypothetical protein
LTNEQPTYAELENSIYRHIFHRSASRKDIEAVMDEFWAGNWSAFGIWAREVMAGRERPAPSGATSPHATFWSMFLSRASADEKKGFLELLLRAQLANRVIKGRPGRVPPEGFTPACRRAVLEYLAAFEEPCHAVDPNTILGGRLVRYSHYPDERIVDLVGMYNIIEAIPILERFLKVRRRFFQLHVDYCTRPGEIDALFVETLLAFVRIALSSEKEREGVLDLLKRHQLANRGKEAVWFEVLSHNNYTGDCSQYVKDEEMAEMEGLGSKRDLIGMAIKAIEEDGKDRRVLEGFSEEGSPPTAPYRWVQPGLDGGGVVDGDRLYFLGGFTIEAMDIPSGRTYFRIDTGVSGDNLGVGCYYPVMVRNADGDPVLVALLDDRTGAMKEWHSFVLDRDTGEVKRAFRLAHQPVRAWGPQVWCRPDGGTVFRMREEKRLWKQDRDGATVWERDLKEIRETTVVTYRDDIIGILDEEGLTIITTDTNETLLQRPWDDMLKDAGVEGSYRDELILLKDRFLIFTRDGHKMCFDLDGRFQWMMMPEQGGWFLTDQQPLGDGFWGQNNDDFYIISPKGDIRDFKKPCSNVIQHVVNDLGVIFLTDGDLLFRPFDAKEARSIVPGIPYQTNIVAFTNEHLVVNYFDNDRFLAYIPRDSW